jgi:hypothetical protein
MEIATMIIVAIIKPAFELGTAIAASQEINFLAYGTSTLQY